MTAAAAALAAALGAAAVAPLAALPAAGSPAAVRSAPAAVSAAPVTVALDALRPLAPQPGQTLHLAVTLHNVSPGPVTGLAVKLVLSTAHVATRSQFDSYAADPAGPPPSGALALPATVHLPTSTLPPGVAAVARLHVAVDSLPSLGAWQVYPMAVVVTGTATAPGPAATAAATPAGSTPGSPTGSPAGAPPTTAPVGSPGTVGVLRTFLPWAPVNASGVGFPTRVAWVWPLIDRPHRAAAGHWLDTALASELGPTGRLSRLVHAAVVAARQHSPRVHARPRHHKNRKAPAPPPRVTVRPVPVSWAIDPMLVDDASAMARGYTVAVAGHPRPGPGTVQAKAWLDALTAAAAGDDVLRIPYADPDIEAASRSGLATDVEAAGTVGERLLSDDLQVSPAAIAWPPDGLLDTRGLNTLFDGGVSTVVLDSSALPVSGGAFNETPSAHALVRARDGSVDALLADHGLSTVLADGALAGADSALATQQLLSELLMIQSERPYDQRSLVLAPPQRWAPTAAYADALLTGSGQVPWVQPVSLSAVAAAPVTAKVPRGPLSYPPEERERQLRPTYLRSVARIGAQVNAFASILPAAVPPTSFATGILRLLSSAWRDDANGARASRHVLEDQVTATMRRVHIVGGGGESTVTLTSHSGAVPVTISNDLDTSVRLVIGLDAGRHLVVPAGRVSTTIAAHRETTVDVRATAQTSGVFPLVVTLYTPHLQRYGRPVEIFVRSTAYGATALFITGGATAALLLAVAIRLVRRARGSTRQPADVAT